MKPLTLLELKALVPALSGLTLDATQGQIASHISKGRLRRNDDGTFDAFHLHTLWALDPDHEPKSDEAKASLLGKRIEALDAQKETLQNKIIPLDAERELLRVRRLDFMPIEAAADARDRESAKEKTEREKVESSTSEATIPSNPKRK